MLLLLPRLVLPLLLFPPNFLPWLVLLPLLRLIELLSIDLS